MITVGIARPTKFYGPEVFALVRHFADDPDVRYQLVDEADLDDPTLDAAHVMMGFSPLWQRHRVPRIHDYASSSTPPRRRVKDLVKGVLSERPVLRSFLSPYVRQQMGFRDTVPYVYRDMGVPDAFYDVGSPTKEVDIGYAGSLTTARGLATPLTALAQAGFRLRLIGEPQAELRDLLAGYPTVEFTGRLDQGDVPGALAACRYGLNFVPDAEPYNQQTSTKVLEYCALGLNIVTNDYPWVRQFQAAHGARFAVLDPAQPPTPESLASHPFVTPDPDQFRWEHVLRSSGLRDRLLEVIRGR